jgi:glycosyltransferase involved in cell wall biosynthesis
MRINVAFAGFLNQSDIVTAYAACDVLVLPSDGGETWGLVVNEAMCCGLPCIISNQVGCGPDLVISGQNGFIYPVGDIEALSVRMVDCAGDPDRLISMGKNARTHMNLYSVHMATIKLVEAVSKVVDAA